ncbi:DNA replication and repair protein RecF [uncultured archaeon]|nr:DNA replication and repair protein RecF [uncultured archaeon]
MVKRLKLENFRGVKQGEIELGDLTILVGSNNSAKTTILEALFLMPNPFRLVPYMIPTPNLSTTSADVAQKTSTELTAASLVHEMHKTLNSQGYIFLFYKYIAKEATIEWDDGNYLKFVKSGRTIYATSNIPSFKGSRIPAPPGDIDYFGWLYLSDARGEELPDYQGKLLTPESLLISSEFKEFAYLYMNNNWANIFNLGIAKEVAQDISQMVNENFVNITIEPFLGGNLSIFGFLEDGSRIRLGDLGSGAQIYIVSRMLYELKKPKILLWDDIEAHLNPRMLVRIGEWFSELVEDGVQVVVSTHSLEAVKILAEFNKDAKICLTSLEDGLLKKKIMSIEEVNNLQSAGVDIRLADTMII